jgi:hypothetical protein
LVGAIGSAGLSCHDDGPAACTAAGGRCVLGGFENCLRHGSQNCNPGMNPGGAFCCLEEPAACKSPDDSAANVEAANYDQSCQSDDDCLAIGEGNACFPCQLMCNNAAIRRDAEAAYRGDVAKIGPTLDPRIRVDCGCPLAAGPCCIDSQCRAGQVCTAAR